MKIFSFRNIFSTFLCLLLILFTLNVAFPSSIEISASVDRDTINVGDVIEYTITVKALEGVKVDFSEKGLKMGDFELLGFSKSDQEEVDGKTKTDYKCRISVYNTGDFEIPPVELKYTDKDNKVKTVRTEKPIKIEVKTILPEDAQDIQDIKPPRDIESPFPYRLLYYLIGILILLVILILIGLWLYRRRKSSPGEKPFLPLLSPEEEAHRAMDELLKTKLLDEGNLKDFYIKLSDILRRYLERRFTIMTFEKTTEEIMEQMERRVKDDSAVSHKLNPVLREFDLVKFAKWRPSVTEARGHVLKTRSFVDDTTPGEETSESEEPVIAKKTGEGE